jgi:hypothetical protein
MSKLQGKSEKLSFNYSVIDKKIKMEVDHHKSPFSLDVQRSKYISVDTDVMDN